jgi:hypothetical protein
VIAERVKAGEHRRARVCANRARACVCVCVTGSTTMSALERVSEIAASWKALSDVAKQVCALCRVCR